MQARIAVFTLLLLSILGFSSLQGQLLYHITWDTGNVPAPNVQTFNDTVRYSLTVNNNSGQLFNDSIRFNLRTSLGVFEIARFDTVQIPSGGSSFFSFLDSTYSSKYGGGINVVVVWPTSPAQIQTDSLIDTLTIGTVHVNPPQSWSSIEVFPVPATNEVSIRVQKSTTQIRTTMLIDVTGRVILSFEGLPPSIPIADLPKALYFIRVEDVFGRTTTIKVPKL